jgi:hypothetical protein
MRRTLFDVDPAEPLIYFGLLAVAEFAGVAARPQGNRYRSRDRPADGLRLYSARIATIGWTAAARLADGIPASTATRNAIPAANM